MMEQKYGLKDNNADSSPADESPRPMLKREETQEDLAFKANMSLK
jgi:hypothetical protein